MEKIANLLIGIAIVCTILLVFVIIAVFLYYKKTKAMANKLLAGSMRDADFVYRLLRTAFPQGHIIRHASIPLNNEQSALADLILVDRGGIFVIRVKTFPGMIDNTNRTTWTVTNQKGVGQFPNPFEQNRLVLTAVDGILRAEHITNIPKHNLVVFSQKRVSFKIRSEHLLTADRFLDKTADMNKNRFLNNSEINAVINAIKKYRAS